MESSSTSSIEHKSFKYDVFLSYRGEDTRKTFVDHLYASLKRQGIRTYKDDERIEQGENINDELLKSIEESKFFIIVFSSNYASSSWCLDELVKIMQCQKTKQQSAYPVFYDVTPSEVRHQRGLVGGALAKHNGKVFSKWIEALKKAGDLAGWELKNTDNGHEAKCINRIVGKISLKLHVTNFVDEKLVGMDVRVELVLRSYEISFKNVQMIGIKGMGGSGKTTLARAIFDKICIQFEGKSFVENVSGVSKASLTGLKSLQKQVLSDVLRDQGITVSSVYDGISMINNTMRGKKVLIVLDDVDHKDQLAALVCESSCLKRGSTIIITTRDEQLLVAHGVNVIHDVNLLEDDEAICLFSKYAFGTHIPAQGYGMLSRQVVTYAAGLPLTIKVLGSFLCGKSKLEWIDALERLRKIPLKETQEKLELSYIGLEEDYKEIFLDVACFLNRMHKDDAIRMLESCGFNARIGLKVLEQRSLISVSNDQYLGMHDHIQEMGRNIVRRVHHEPSRHSRLWICEEIENILAYGFSTDKTRAIAVDDCLVKLNSKIVTKGFRSLKNLRFLHLLSLVEDDYSCWDEITEKVGCNFPSALQYLSWEFYPHCSLPKTYGAVNLVALEMSDSRIVRLWDGHERKALNKLRFLNLRHSQLTTLDLRLTPNLERLDLEDCYDLVQLHCPIHCLKRLAYLNLSGCSRIASFSFIKSLESLEVLCLSHLYMKEFPDIIPQHRNSLLRELRFRYNDIEELPSSIGNLQKLVYLDLRSCTKLRILPGSICGLRNLRKLKLYGCILEELPEDIERLKCLEKLNMSFTRIKHLPASICFLKRLKTLNLSSCWNLENLPQDLGRLECLENLILNECTHVRYIPESICKLKHLRTFSLSKCVQLDRLPKELGLLKRLKVLDVKGTRIRQLPHSISLLKTLKIYESKSLLRLHGSASSLRTLKASSSIKKRKYDHR